MLEIVGNTGNRLVTRGSAHCVQRAAERRVTPSIQIFKMHPSRHRTVTGGRGIQAGGMDAWMHKRRAEFTGDKGSSTIDHGSDCKAHNVYTSKGRNYSSGMSVDFYKVHPPTRGER